MSVRFHTQHIPTGAVSRALPAFEICPAPSPTVRIRCTLERRVNSFLSIKALYEAQDEGNVPFSEPPNIKPIYSVAAWACRIPAAKVN